MAMLCTILSQSSMCSYYLSAATNRGATSVRINMVCKHVYYANINSKILLARYLGLCHQNSQFHKIIMKLDTLLNVTYHVIQYILCFCY